MRKRYGFSIIELLITVAIMGIITFILLPNFSKIQSINAFRAETEHITDALLEARMNALTEKMCDDIASENWIFDLNLTGFSLKCTYFDENEPPELQEIEVNVRNFSPEILVIRIEFDGDPDQEGNIVSYSFSPNQQESKIIHENIQKDDVKVVLSHPTSDESKTICFNRIAGFPKVFDGDTACPE